MGDSRLELDERLGRLALDRGFLTSAQLRAALDARDREGITLSEALLSMRLLTNTQLLRLCAEAETAPRFPPLGRFTLARELGRGSSAVVYEALDDGQRVALKVFHPGPAADLHRFIREGAVAAKIPPHPGIVPVLEAGEAQGRHYLAMELVDGLHMDDWIRRGSVAFPAYVAALRDAARAVDHAHRHGVVHRDLKPENILIDEQGRARVSDFGLAKTVESKVTATGFALGTPAYMSPEQIRGKDVDRRSDIWALGVMLYEGLTGKRPFPGKTAFESMRRAVEEPPVPPSKATRLQMNPLLFGTIERVTLKALAKEPRERYSSARDFAEDLDRWLRGETFDVRLSPDAAAPPKKRRSWTPLAVAAVLGAGVATSFFLLPRREPAAPALRTSPGAKGALLEYYGGLQFNTLGMRDVDARRRFLSPADPVWPNGPEYYVSTRWAGRLRAPARGAYVFHLRSREGARLVVARTELVAHLIPNMATDRQARVALEAGPHDFLLEAFHSGAPEEVELSWGLEGRPLQPLGPGDLTHDPTGFTPTPPPADNGPIAIPGAQEGEALEVVDRSGRDTAVVAFENFRPFWRGRWSGKAHLWWGSGSRRGDVLTVRFRAEAAGPRALALGLTRAMDGGVFAVAVNGRATGRTIDLYSADLATERVEIPGVPLRAGENELTFRAVDSNPAAREWSPGGGLYKLGLDYVLVK